MNKPATHNNGMDAPWAVLTAWNGPTTTLLHQASETCLKAYAKWQQEAAHFTRARFEKDRTALASFATCESLADLFKVQQEWAFSAIRDYFEEGTRLSQLLSSPARPEHESVAEPSPTAHQVQAHAAE